MVNTEFGCLSVYFVVFHHETFYRCECYQVLKYYLSGGLLILQSQNDAIKNIFILFFVSRIIKTQEGENNAH